MLGLSRMNFIKSRLCAINLFFLSFKFELPKNALFLHEMCFHCFFLFLFCVFLLLRF